MFAKETWFCAACGSEDIRHDAVAKWDADNDAWVVLEALDGTWCHPCQLRNPLSSGEPSFGVPLHADADAEEAQVAA